MVSNNKCIGRALRIVVGITMLTILFAGNASAEDFDIRLGYWIGATDRGNSLNFNVSNTGLTYTIQTSIYCHPYWVYYYRTDVYVNIIDKSFSDFPPIRGTFTSPKNVSGYYDFSMPGCLSSGQWWGRPSKKGDVDGDRYVTAADALLYLRYAVGQAISPFYIDASDDVTCDGAIQADDALKVLRKAVGQDVNLICP